MRELGILVEKRRLLPINYGYASHELLVRDLRRSPHANASSEDWDTFVKGIERTTNIKQIGDYHGRLRQVCLHEFPLL